MLSIVIILMDGSRNWLKLEKTICNQINDSDGNNDSGKKKGLTKPSVPQVAVKTDW